MVCHFKQAREISGMALFFRIGEPGVFVVWKDVNNMLHKITFGDTKKMLYEILALLMISSYYYIVTMYC